jgi:tRNA modification GTPase
VDELISRYSEGSKVKSGVKVAIVGRPNTGKSSLLNALLAYDKAIVSPVAGTTRDVVEGTLVLDGVRYELSDTAGIRESDDKVEELGVQLSKRILDQSDLILFMLDASDVGLEDDAIYKMVKDKNLLVAVNKTDLSDYTDDRADIYLSALKKENLTALKEMLFEKTVGAGLDMNGDFLCEERHYGALLRAKDKLISARNNIGLVPLDLLAIDLKDGWDALGEISGKTATEDIINDIFSKFCVGK